MGETDKQQDALGIIAAFAAEAVAAARSSAGGDPTPTQPDDDQRMAEKMKREYDLLVAREKARERHRTLPSKHVPSLKALSAEDLDRAVFPLRRGLLYRGDVAVIREGYIGQIYAQRGIGKTWFAQTLALVAATGVEALGFSAGAPCRVLYIDGEMASEEIQERFRRLTTMLDAPSTQSRLQILASDWQDEYIPRLDTPDGRAAVEPYVEDADLIILDNRSCLFDPEGEKDPSAWQQAQDWLLALRRRGKAVIILHHTNRAGGARGHSKAEDVMNVLIALARPDDYSADQGARFTVTWEKARAAHGEAVAPFEACLTPSGWDTLRSTSDSKLSAHDKLVNFMVVAARAGEYPKSASTAITAAKVNKQAGLKAWADLKDGGQLRQREDGGWEIVFTRSGDA